MTSYKSLDPANPDTAEWNSAWEAVRRLADARRSALSDIKAIEPSRPASMAAADYSLAPALTEQTTAHALVADPAQYARAIAEIEQASAALRRAEPALEAWNPRIAVPSEPRAARSIWVVVGGIWLSAVLVVAGAVGATLFLLG